MTNQDSPISLLDPAGALTGSELTVFVQGGQTVRGNYNDLKTWILSSVVTGGDVTAPSNLTSGRYPVASGLKTIVDGRIYQDANTIFIESPNGLTTIAVSNASVGFHTPTTGGLSDIDVTASQAAVQYSSTTGGGELAITSARTRVNHGIRIDLDSPEVRYPNLSASTVTYLDSSKIMRSLAAGTNGQVLTLVSGLPAWATPSSATGTVTSITAGAGLSGGAITTSGTIAIANLGVTNAMIANGTIDLTTKVTSVLKYANGGTGTSSSPTAGALPIAGSTGYQYDYDNFNYDTTQKRLCLNNLFISPDDGQPGAAIEAAGNCLTLTGLDAGYEALIITSSGGSIKADAAIGIAGKFSSSEFAGEYNQMGVITADNDYPALTINRIYTRPASGAGSSAKATGPVLFLNDTTTALGTGSGILYSKKSATSGSMIKRFEAAQDGRISYTVQEDVKISVSGSLFSTISGTSTTGSTATDIFSNTIKGGTLSANGDEVFARYNFNLNETTKTKVITVSFAGTTIFTSPTFSLVAAGGRGEIIVSIMRVGSNAISYRVSMSAHENGTSTALVSYSNNATGSPTLTSDQVLKVTATCQSGSADGGVVGLHAKGILNPNN